MKKQLLEALLFILVSTFMGKSFSQNVIVSFREKSGSIVQGEPFFIGTDIVSDAPVTIDLGPDHIGAFGVTIQDHTGIVRPGMFVENRTKGADHAESLGSLTLVPRVHYHQWLTLSPASLPEVGNYTLQFLANVNGREIVQIGSVTVKKKEPAALRLDCDLLANEIISDHSIASQLSLIRGLISIEDPAAIPALKAVASADIALVPKVVAAIEKFDTDEAVDSLSALAKSKNEEVKTSAVNSLTRLLSKPETPERLSKISGGLAASSR